MYKSKITKEQKLAAIDQVAAGQSISHVAAACGVVENTLYRWIREAHKELQNLQFNNSPPRPRPLIRAQRKFTETFKRDLAQQVIDGAPVAQVAAAFDIAKERIYVWVHAFFPAYKFDKNTGPHPSPGDCR